MCIWPKNSRSLNRNRHSVALLFFLSFLQSNLYAGSPAAQPGTSNTNQNVNTQSAQVQQFSIQANRDSLGRKIYKENEFIVSFKNTVTASTSAQMIKQYATSAIKTLGKNKNIKLISVDPGQTLKFAMDQFRSNPNVASVSHNYYVYAMATPNDTYYSQQWGVSNTSLSNINVVPAWDHITDCSSVTVAVLDTGINYTHSDLAANMVTANMYDFVDNDNDVYPDAGHEQHGTNVAGIIGARGNNNRGTSGICWQIKMLPLRVLNESGIGNLASVSNAIIHAVDNGAKVINMSLAAYGTTTAMDNAMNYALAKKVVIVAAAGNNGSNNDTSALYPCNYSRTHANVICVAAMDQTSALASFSNRGTSTVDVGAPGVSIYSASPGAWFIDSMLGWAKTGSWTESPCSFPYATNMLSNPVDYCTSAGPYANNANEVAYKNFNLSTADRASLIYNIIYSVQTEVDSIKVSTKASGGNPFIAGSLIKNHTGTSPNSGSSQEYNRITLNGCFTTACTIGFNLQSDASVSSGGVGVFGLRIETSQRNADSYLAFSGTSQAAPHVAGLAAMIMAWNTGYEPIQTIAAIKNGGTLNATLSGTTSSGRVINAMGSLKYINTPKNVSVTISQ